MILFKEGTSLGKSAPNDVQGEPSRLVG